MALIKLLKTSRTNINAQIIVMLFVFTIKSVILAVKFENNWKLNDKS